MQAYFVNTCWHIFAKHAGMYREYILACFRNTCRHVLPRAGAYFVTICVQHRECMLGEIINRVMRLHDAGKIAEQCWRDIPLHFPHAALDEWTIMPNEIGGTELSP